MLVRIVEAEDSLTLSLLEGERSVMKMQPNKSSEVLQTLSRYFVVRPIPFTTCLAEEAMFLPQYLLCVALVKGLKWFCERKRQSIWHRILSWRNFSV